MFKSILIFIFSVTLFQVVRKDLLLSTTKACPSNLNVAAGTDSFRQNIFSSLKLQEYFCLMTPSKYFFFNKTMTPSKHIFLK